MSIEVEESKDQGTSAEPIAPAPIVLPVPARPRPIWHRRQYQIAALVAVVVLVAAFVGNNLLAGHYSAEGAVRQYLSALLSGDANSAWSVMQVSSPTQQPTASLLGKQDLQAALAGDRPDLGSFTIDSTTQVNASTSTVSISYETADGSKQAQFTVTHSGQTQFLLYQGWRLMIAPTILQISVPTGGQGVAIDGKPVALVPGTSSVAVLPVSHKIAFKATAMLQAQTLSIDSLLQSSQVVDYVPNLTDAGAAAAQAALKTAFAACAQKAELSPDGCPQSYKSGFFSSYQWQLVGDPTQNVALDFDQNLNLTGNGYYQMVISYQEAGVTGISHDISAGGFSAALTLTAANITVGGIKAQKVVTALQRPAGATDEAAKDIVSKALAHCASLQGLKPADCPQGLISAYATNVHWSLSGDPMAGASVAFDENTGVFTVTGSFQMNASYQISGYPSSDSSYYDHYYAYLLWNGQALQVVTIAGGFS